MSNVGLDEGAEEMQEIDLAEIKKLKVQELRVKLTELGLSAKGNKPELITRLIEHYQKEAEEELGDDLLDEENFDDSYDGESKPADGDAKKAAVTQAAVDDVAQATDTTVKKEPLTINTKPPAATVGDANSDKVTNKPITQLTEKERAELRAKKFGVSDEEAKKVARRERFGPVDDGGLTKRAKLSDEEMEKLKARATRFGTSVAPALTSIEDDAKRKEREKKFGVVPVTSMSMEARKQKRAAKFNS